MHRHLILCFQVLSHDIKKDGNILRFRFFVKFYPEDLTDELIQMITQVTRQNLEERLYETLKNIKHYRASDANIYNLIFIQKLFFLQARDSIVNDSVYCPTDKAVLLASLSVCKTLSLDYTSYEQSQATVNRVSGAAS